ncbi:hypothetical protein O4160_02665 [Rhodococcus sp. IEGM 1401]|uniref:Uncharacterized protein n=2 Tax=Rhodococcus TaxID=1827 RepID=A0ABU4B075_9NOCA|nr:MULTISPECIES: hypothetical protein [Rhodococcus]KAA0925938.1 hypothetical protein FQ188_10290 [Rhodococcus sp. ANT_H53B]KZF00976.1 hypothetical protein A2J02_07900 [Rhodococcus sp. EPR-147]KZF02338.1 hypothetical protein A2J04_09270 [Rhodococcus sp. EPR-279]MCZ4559738.1 hypothetical protein [Rhodococcus sp. IEGM 1401]MDI9920218.1 hypothetical protein [Rhodococcus sp. IEGM 1372]
MSIFETTLIFGVIPVAVIGLLGALSYLTDKQPGMDVPPYRLTDEWTREPLLWTATDEVTPFGGHGSHGADTADSIGGSASGKW